MQETQKSPGSFLVVSLILYFVFICLMSASHEVWRDEVRALNIVVESNSFLDIFSLLRNEGHPVLWYALLSLAYGLFGDPIVLKLCSILCALLAAIVFLKKAPFSFPLKFLWLFGFYPAYEYSVLSRNYGIGMLLIFLSAAAYKERENKPILLGGLLALLAQTSAYGIIHALAFVVVLIVEPLVHRTSRSRHPIRASMIASAVALIGIVFSVYCIYPERSTVVTELHSLGIASVLSAIIEGIVRHGSSFHNGLVSPIPWVVPLVLGGLYLLMFRTPLAVAYLASVAIGMEAFNILIYSGAALRHQGFLLLGILAAIWIHRDGAPKIKYSIPKLSQYSPRAIDLGVGILLLLQVYAGVKACLLDANSAWSSSEAFSHSIAYSPEFSDLIIAAEPDYVLESLPFYLKNRTFLAREGRFGAVVSFTSISRAELTLGELLDELGELSRREEKGILLLLPVDFGSKASIDVGYGRTFSASEADWARFLKAARKLNCFDGAIMDENYCSWLLD